MTVLISWWCRHTGHGLLLVFVLPETVAKTWVCSAGPLTSGNNPLAQRALKLSAEHIFPPVNFFRQSVGLVSPQLRPLYSYQLNK